MKNTRRTDKDVSDVASDFHVKVSSIQDEWTKISEEVKNWVMYNK